MTVDRGDAVVPGLDFGRDLEPLARGVLDSGQKGVHPRRDWQVRARARMVLDRYCHAAERVSDWKCRTGGGNVRCATFEAETGSRYGDAQRVTDVDLQTGYASMARVKGWGHADLAVLGLVCGGEGHVEGYDARTRAA